MSFFNSELDSIIHEIKSFPSHASTLVLLEGPLGAGKTTFVQEFIEKLGGKKESVQSPTFLKILEYTVPAFGKIVHMDTYRMEKSSELGNLGLEFLLSARIWFVEWPELFLDFLKQREDIRRDLDFKNVFCLKINFDAAAGVRKVKWTRVLGSLGGGIGSGTIK